jgi:hypothetical protein
MKRIKVTNDYIAKAKSQVGAFKATKKGKYRYSGVEAWKGVVCELIVSAWLRYKFSRLYIGIKEAKGLDCSGVYDDYDMLINGKKIEIKSATKYSYKSIMPKVYDVEIKPKDFYIGAKYNETVTPNEVEVIGYIKHSDILKYPKDRNKGAEYYNIPLIDLKPIDAKTLL